MKKVALFVTAVAVTAITLVSCSKKKDYTCVCNVSGQETRTPLNDVKKSQAEDACNSQNSTAALLGGSCNLQ